MKMTKMMKMMKVTAQRARVQLIYGLAIALGLWSVAPARALTVYHIGNSVTDTLQYNRLQQVASGFGNTYTYGRHMIPGSPLSWIYQNPTSGFNEAPYGYYPNALPNYTWDVLTLQPFDRQISGADGDRVMAGNYINLALSNPANSSMRVLIYSRWPRRNQISNNPPIYANTFYGLTYQAQWDRTYTDPDWNGGFETRDYFEKLVNVLRTDFPSLTIDMAPVGDVLYELANRMQLNQINHFTNIVQIYSDGIHFYDGGPHGNIGSYAASLTFYATMFKSSPVGDTNYGLWGITDAVLANQIQQTVWDVVAGHPYSGVAPIPEPSTWLLLVGGLGAVVWLRSRVRI
jgi:hypothetical protein